MRIFVLLCALSAIGLINTQATQLEILKAWNYARQNPTIFANKLSVLANGKDGIKGDATCYKDAIAFLKKQAKLPTLSEDAGLDVSAAEHSNDLLNKVKKLTHVGSNGSKAEVRLAKYGRFHGAYEFNEMLSFTKQTKPVTGNRVIMMFLADCGVKTRMHRKIILNETVTHFGAASSYANKETYFVLLATKGYTRKPLTNAQLVAARVEGDGLYSGDGSDQNTAFFRNAAFFKQNRPQQIHTLKKIYNMVDTNPIAVGDLKDDSSVKCPQFINFKTLGKSLVRGWTLTSSTCKRLTGAFTATNNLDRILPYAKAGKCYHRLSFCDTKGRVWVIDREYKTLQEYSPVSLPQKSVLGGAGKSDSSVKCPTWINPNLRKRIVQDWYMNGSKCIRGSNGYAGDGSKRLAPFAWAKKCYHRFDFCDEKGRVWIKDSEYKTMKEYEATQ